jgi:hypothetical protein
LVINTQVGGGYQRPISAAQWQRRRAPRWAAQRGHAAVSGGILILSRPIAKGVRQFAKIDHAIKCATRIGQFLDGWTGISVGAEH